MSVARSMTVIAAGWILICILIPGFACGESPSHSGGAASLLLDARDAYRSGEYARSETLLTRFLNGYASSPEAKASLKEVWRLLSLSLLQQQKFKQARPWIEHYLGTGAKGEQAVELSYWQAVCLYQEKEYEAAYAKLTGFAGSRRSADSDADLNPDRREQVLMMRAMCRLAQRKFDQVIEILSGARDGLSADTQGRILALMTYCHMELRHWDALLAEIRKYDPYAEGMNSLSRMNLLCVRAGSALMKEGRYRDALLVLQKAWPKQRIVSRQEKRLESLREKLRLARKDGGGNPAQDAAPGLEERIGQVEADLDKVRNTEEYDAALRYRIARCFYALERYREAYLVFSGMIEQLGQSELLRQAHYQMLVSLTRMNRWQEAVEAAGGFEKNSPESPLLANVLYLKAEALMRLNLYEKAADVFKEVIARFPSFAQAERCHFLIGYCELMLEHHQEAVDLFARHLERWPDSGEGKAPHQFGEQARYWKAMAYYYDKQYAKSRAAHADYLKHYPQGRYAVDSEYRMAYALYGQRKRIEAYKELEAFIRKHGKTLLADEAENLLGDCYFAMGEINRGLKAYRRTTKRNGRLYDYAQFRIGKAYRAMESYDAMRKHFRRFLEERPESSRVTEALSNLAWLDRKEGHTERARELYWKSIKNYGNNPEAACVEEMLRTLARYYHGEDGRGRKAYVAGLAQMARQARKHQPTLAARALWMQAQLLPENESAARREQLHQIIRIADPKEMSPVVLADVADSLRESRQWRRAETCYRTMLFWYPRSLLKDRAYAGLGLMYQQQGRPAEAIRYYHLFERETVKSPLWANVLQSRAAIYREQGNLTGAVQDLERILKIDSARGKPWVEALYQVGEIYLREKDPRKAIPYFQRIYIMYGRWSDYVARAYWKSGQAFEALNMRREAVNTYRECAHHTHLKAMPEYHLAVERLRQLGEPVPLPERTPHPTAEKGGV